MENIIGTDYDNMAGMVIMKDGKAVYEKYFNGCTKDNRIHAFFGNKKHSFNPVRDCTG